MNSTPLKILKNSLFAALGLFFFSFGVYLIIQAGVGAAPWDVFNLGLSNTFGIKYGNANIIVSITIVIIDVILGEQIGIGTLLDAFLVGKYVDLFNYLGLVGNTHSLPVSLILIFVGMFILGFAQYFYMKSALSCGPRDSLMVGLKRKIPKIPIGIISMVIMVMVTVVGYLLGGPVGIGTLIAALLEGPIMQLDFKLVNFIPTDVKHQNIIESFKVIMGKR